MLALVISSDSNFDEVNNAKVSKKVLLLFQNVEFLDVAYILWRGCKLAVRSSACRGGGYGGCQSGLQTVVYTAGINNRFAQQTYTLCHVLDVQMINSNKKRNFLSKKKELKRFFLPQKKEKKSLSLCGLKKSIFDDCLSQKCGKNRRLSLWKPICNRCVYSWIDRRIVFEINNY